jgi:acetyl esterase/lipase
MNTKISRMFTFIFALAIMSTFANVGNAQEGVWEIGPRKLPLSVGVSDAFRESQANTPTLDPSVMDFVPATEEEWLIHIKEKDAGAAAVALELASALNVTIKEDKIGGVNVHWVSPPEIDVEHKGHLFIYIHGGAYVYNGGMAGLVEPALIAHHLKIKVVSIDYRMPPKHPAPAFVGLGLPVPAALYIGTPTVDLNAKAGDSRHLNEGADRILIKMGNFGVAAMNLYAGDLGLNHPYVSPIFGDFAGLPPTYLITGTRDLLLSDAVRAHRALRRAGIEAELHVYEGQGHADYIVAMKTPESAEHYAELNRFMLEHLSHPIESSSPEEELDDIEVPESATF